MNSFIFLVYNSIAVIPMSNHMTAVYYIAIAAEGPVRDHDNAYERFSTVTAGLMKIAA